MKISEFKERLNQLEELHGDVEVMINTGETAHGWEIAEPYYSNRLGFVGVY